MFDDTRNLEASVMDVTKKIADMVPKSVKDEIHNIDAAAKNSLKEVSDTLAKFGAAMQREVKTSQGDISPDTVKNALASAGDFLKKMENVAHQDAAPPTPSTGAAEGRTI